MFQFRVNVLPAADDGSGFYRMRLPAQTLKAEGVDVEVVSGAEHRWCEVAVIQRPLRKPVLDAIDYFHSLGIAVVVDVDDDFDGITPNHAAWPTIQPSPKHDMDWRVVGAACAKADLVTVTTPALAKRYAKHGRVAVLPNYIPESYLSVERESHAGTWVGWSGTVRSHPNDLQQTRGAVARACAESGASFAVVGDVRGVADAVGTVPINLGWASLDAYPQAVANFDVGVVPLDRTNFNEAKSWLKGLEMAALGVPFVASPTSPYRELAALGIGELAVKPVDWHKKTSRLIQDSAFRRAKAEEYRAKARSLTVEANCLRWLDAWNIALNNFRAASLSLSEG